MDAGVRVRNDYGSLQLSSQNTSLMFIRKGTHSATTGSQPSPIGTRSQLTLTGVTNPLLAIRPQGGQSACPFMMTRSGSTAVLSFMASGTSSTLIDWWLFDNAVPVAAMTCGLKVRGPDGVLTFSSATPTLRVVPSQVSGGSYAAVLGAVTGAVQWVPGAPGQNGAPDVNLYRRQMMWNGVKDLGGGQISVAQFLADRATTGYTRTPPADTTYGPLNYLLVDVRNL